MKGTYIYRVIMVFLLSRTIQAKQVQDLKTRNATSMISCWRVSWTEIGHLRRAKELSSRLGKCPEEPPKTQTTTTTTTKGKESKEKGFESN